MNGERIAFENWLGIKPCGAAHDLAWAAWKARASLPVPQQATPDCVPQSLLMRLAGIAAECSDPDTTDAIDALIAATQQATPEPVGEPDTVPLDALHAAERERDYWKTRARAMLDHAEGTCWYWMGDGEDHLESLVNSLPVVIRADQLRELLARPAQGVPKASA